MLAYLPCLFAACLLVQDDKSFSGPQPSEPLASFTTDVVLGEYADKSVDLVEIAAGKPIVIVFVHEKTRPAFGMSNLIMRLTERYGQEKLIGGLIYLTEDPTETLAWMRQVQGLLPKKVIVGMSPDGQEGPGAYGLNRHVAVTVLVAKNSKVTANFALVQPSIQVDAPEIFKAIAGVLGETEVPKVSDLMPNGRMAVTPPPTTPAAAPQDPKLRPLLQPLIQRQASEADVIAAANKIEDYAKQNPESRQQIGDIARRMITAQKLQNYGTKKCQEYLTRWAKEFTASPSESPTPESGSPKE